MHVWYHQPTISVWRRISMFLGTLTLIVAFITTGLLVFSAKAAPGINETLNFQGRLLKSTGGIVPDGYYNMQFKIYEGGNGKTAGGGTGATEKWHEDYTNNGTNAGVQVINGFFSVNLGSKTAFGSSVDWNQDTLWLSMNVAGSTNACSTFSSCSPDGEMLPMKRITAAPYAMNAGKLGGKTSDDFIHNSTDQQTGDFNISGTGTANILQGSISMITPSVDSDITGILGIGNTNASTINIGTSDDDHTINIGTGIGEQNITIGSMNGIGKTTIQGGVLGVNINTYGYFTVNDDRLMFGSTEDGAMLRISGGQPGENMGMVYDSDLSQATIFAQNTDHLLIGGSSDVIIQGGGNNGTIALTATGSNVQIGTGSGTGTPMLLTLDTTNTTPVSGEGAAPKGSMYYDTSLNAVQCFNGLNWGSCDTLPDTFVSLSPEFAGAVLQGSGDGTLTASICSSDLGINTDICNTNETYNFYKWTAPSASTQSYNIFVSYQLPNTFSGFVSGSTSLLGRTDSSNSAVAYQVYRKANSGAMTPCGSSQTVSNVAQTSWQKKTATSTADPASCNFAANDTLYVKITVSAKSDANAYVGPLSFAYRNAN